MLAGLSKRHTRAFGEEGGRGGVAESCFIGMTSIANFALRGGSWQIKVIVTAFDSSGNRATTVKPSACAATGDEPRLPMHLHRQV